VTIVKADFTRTLPPEQSTAHFEIPTAGKTKEITVEASMVYKIEPEATPVLMYKTTKRVALK
jgi:hypothetical protein